MPIRRYEVQKDMRKNWPQQGVVTTGVPVLSSAIFHRANFPVLQDSSMLRKVSLAYMVCAAAKRRIADLWPPLKERYARTDD